jgi:hypothetical protein
MRIVQIRPQVVGEWLPLCPPWLEATDGYGLLFATAEEAAGGVVELINPKTD